MIEGNHYTDFNALDIRSKKPVYERNNGIWKQVRDLVEEHNGTLEFPARIQGFYFELDENERGYATRIIPAKNFRVIVDKDIGSENGERQFNVIKENGVVKPEKGGRFKHYIIDNGVSRVCLDGSGGLDSVYGDLAGSGGNGRVVVVGAEGVAQKNLED